MAKVAQLSLLTPTANCSRVTTAQSVYTAAEPSVFISGTFLDTFYSLMAKALVSFELNDLFLYWKFVSAVVLVLFLFFAILSRLFGTTGNLRNLWENISQPGLFSLNTISFLAELISKVKLAHCQLRIQKSGLFVSSELNCDNAKVSLWHERGSEFPVIKFQLRVKWCPCGLVIKIVNQVWWPAWI